MSPKVVSILSAQKINPRVYQADWLNLFEMLLEKGLLLMKLLPRRVSYFTANKEISVIHSHGN